MKRIIFLLIVTLLTVPSSCALGDRSEGRYNTPTTHALNIRNILSEDPCMDEDWARVDLNRKEYLPVYAAPSVDAYRAADGRAEVCLSEPFSVLADIHDGTWLLIEYEIDDQARRIGYIQTPPDVDVPALDVRPLRMNPKELTVTDAAILTDDPYHSQRSLARLNAGEMITCLGWVDAYYAYAQVMIGGKAAYGFVPLKALAIPASPRICEAEEMLRGVWQFVGGSEMFNDGFVLDGRGGFIDCAAQDNSFPPDDLELDGSLIGRYEVVRNDVPTDEFWSENSPYAFVLRTNDGREWRYVFDYLEADGVERTQDKLMLYRGMGGGNFGRVQGDEAERLLREAQMRLK